MPCDLPGGGPKHNPVVVQMWRDRKRYLWLIGLIVPTLVGVSWLAVRASGLGVFWWAGPIVTFGIVPVLDHIVGPDEENPPDGARARLEDDLFYRWATYLYLPGQYVSLVLACWVWSGGSGVATGWVDKLGLMVTAGGIGGIAINTAHELGHKRPRAERWLSKAALAQTCYGHFYVEHNRGHHVRVATPADPASARIGENLYAFLVRSVVGGVRSAWNIETRRFARAGRSRWSLRNNLLNAWLMTVVLFTVLVVWFGIAVLPWLIGQAIVGFCLLETVNYLEHYGLRRQLLPDGRYERVRPAHSWNSNTVVANLFLFHLQRHSDHHAHPGRRYQSLRHADDAPQLPAGYATMVLLAMFPPAWRAVMDRRVLDHYGGDARLAALKPTSVANRNAFQS